MYWGQAERSQEQSLARPLTWLCGENAHEAREEAVHSSQHLGVPTRHAGCDAPLQGLEATEDGRRLQHSQQEVQHFQPRADVPVVHLVRLLLGRKPGHSGKSSTDANAEF